VLSAVVKSELGHTPTHADRLHGVYRMNFVFAFTIVESSPAVDGPNVTILQHRNSFNVFAICC